jgi:hypothetical protein
MKFAATVLATISASQVSAADANLVGAAPVCDLAKTPRCEDDTKYVCMSSMDGTFMSADTTPVAITLDFKPLVSVCQPVDADGKAVPVDFKLTMSGADKVAIATGLYLAKDFKAVSGAQALVATAAAALSAVYMM